MAGRLLFVAARSEHRRGKYKENENERVRARVNRRERRHKEKRVRLNIARVVHSAYPGRAIRAASRKARRARITREKNKMKNKRKRKRTSATCPLVQKCHET